MTGIVQLTKPITACGMIIMICARSGQPARAADPAPIAISFCAPVYAAAENSPYALGRQTGVEVRFVNHSSATARQVAFRLGDEADAPKVVDRGTFAPGVTIRKIFDTTQPIANTCRVAEARFAQDSQDQTPAAATAQR
jgi:hypothetical protein